MNKKMIVAVCAVGAMTFGAFAGPHGGPGGPGGFRGGPGPAMHGGGPRHHGGGWGHGGANFWPGFVGGVVGGLAVSTIAPPPPRTVLAPAPVVVTPAPVVVTTPTVVTPAPVSQMQNVWVEGRYIDQVQSNGSVLRVWQPGHYEQRTVIVQ